MRRAIFILALVATACGTDTPTTPSTPSASTSENWSSVVAPGGTSTKTFTLSKSGTISVTLTTAGTALGLGVGLPRVTGGGCRLGVAVAASQGTTPQISTAADAGQYCVQVYDLGTLTDPLAFGLKIDHP